MPMYVCDACAILKMKLKTKSHSIRMDCIEKSTNREEKTHELLFESDICGMRETKSGIKSGFGLRFVAVRVYV